MLEAQLAKMGFGKDGKAMPELGMVVMQNSKV